MDKNIDHSQRCGPEMGNFRVSRLLFHFRYFNYLFSTSVLTIIYPYIFPSLFSSVFLSLLL